MLNEQEILNKIQPEVTGGSNLLCMTMVIKRNQIILAKLIHSLQFQNDLDLDHILSAKEIK